jgi:hypothetical protein
LSLIYLLSAGFTGVFYVDQSNSGKVYTLSSSYASVGSQGSFQYDLDLSSVKDLVQQAFVQEGSTSSTATIERDSLSLYAVRADISFKLDDNDVQTIVPEYYPQLYLVRGVSISQWDPLLQKELALSLSSFFIRAASMVFTCWMLFHPIRKFISQLDSSVVKAYEDKRRKQRVKPTSSSSTGNVFKVFQRNRNSQKSIDSSNQVATKVEVVRQYTS